MKRIITLFILLVCTGHLFAQLIDAEPEVTNLCNGSSGTLTATITPPGSGGAPGSLPTDSYAISSVPYNPDPLTAGTAVALTDDTQTGLIPIGFDFCYFGNTYSQFIIGSNNWIGFQTGQTSTYVTTPIPNAGATAPHNTIMGPWQDINPNTGGTVRYSLYGTFPFRRLAVSWNNVPMFSCTGQLYSSQIIIYESSNVIETHILNKSLCPGWNNGNAVHGLHNSTGTVAFVVPGRNNTQWTASNEGTRFTPNGVATYTINWYILPANTLIGTNSFTTPPDLPPYTSTINVTPLISPQSYYAEVTGPNGCGIGAPNTDTVVVNSITILADAGLDTTICEGDSTMLNATGGFSYSWSPATGLSDPAIANPIAGPVNTTTYTVTVMGAFGCTATDIVTISVNPAPLVDAGFSAQMCRGDSIQLGGNGSAGTYLWNQGTTLDDSTILNPNAGPIVTTLYTLTITDALGCSASDTVSVIISNASMNAGINDTICPGTSTTLNGTGGTAYAWLPSTSLSDPNIANPVATPASTTTYTVSITNSGTGCFEIDSVTITVNPPVIADAGSNASICIGNNTTLVSSGGTTYVWTPTSGLSNSTIFNPVASPTTTTTYTVIVGDAAGCVSLDSVMVTVNFLPLVDAGNDFSICIGDTAALSVAGASNYIWSPGLTLNDSTISNPLAGPSVATTYSVTGTDINGCIATDSITISLNGVTITAGTNATICAGTPDTLSVSGALTYVWLPSATLNNNTIPNPIATPTGTTTYTVVGTSGAGCKDTAFVTINVNPLPVVNAGSALLICNGGNANLSVSGANTYLWSPASSLNNPNIPTPIASPTVITLYTVAGTDLNGCVSTDTITVVVRPLPSANAGSNTSICLGSSTALNASGGLSYSWSPATGLSSAIIANPVAAPLITTTYTVTVTGSASCTATSQVTITVNPVPVANAGPDVSICNGTSAALNASGGSTYFWTPGTGLSSAIIPNPTAAPPTTTQYVVTVSNSSGCIDKDTVTVNVSNALTIAPSSVTDETCSNNNGSITAGAITGGSAPYNYSLGGPSQLSPTFSSLAQGNYLLTVTDNNGCAASQSVSVGRVSNVTASFTANPPSGSKPLSVTFTNTSSGATSYFWDLGNGLTSTDPNPTTVYSQTGTYFVVLTATNGGAPCIDIMTFTITVFDDVVIIAPNIFTPNGDGINDIFYIKAEGISKVNGEIFNRWAKKVYDWSGDPQSGWNGKINGGTAEDGTYYYIIKATGSNGKEYEEKGYFQLLGN